MMKKITNEGELMPSFYYGLAYHKWDSFRSVWYPIPLNYIVRGLIWIQWKWNKFRGKKSWIDNEILKALDENDKKWSADLHRAWEEAIYYRELYNLIIDERKETNEHTRKSKSEDIYEPL